MSMTEGLARRLFAVVLFLYSLPALGSSGSPGADQVPEIRAPGAYFQLKAGQERTSASPSDLVQASSRLTAAERHDLGPLTATERIRFQPEPSSGRQREKIGIARNLPQPVVLASLPRGLAAGTERSYAGGIAKREASGRLSWTTAFISPGAAAVRLHITEAYLPPGSRAFVYAESGEVHGPYSFDGGIGPEGFWTNSVAGEQVFLEVQFSGAGGEAAPCRLVVSQVSHRAGPATAGLAAEAVAAPQDTSCFVDVACLTPSDFGPINSASHAIAALDFFDQGVEYLCSGGLIGALGDPTTPYLLTANHCINTQASATSLQATFNFKDSTCNQQPFPDENTFPSTLGSTLLATGTSSDFTLVVLSQPPPSGAFLLGWSTQDVSGSNGTQVYQISHPAPGGVPWPQYFMRASIVASPTFVCPGAPVGPFLYTSQQVGGTTEGGSGSPAMLADGSVVGQLFAICGSGTLNPCNSGAIYQLDGAFRASYSSVAQWLSPQRPAGTLLCLGNGRFCVTADWQSSTASGSGTAVQLTPDTGYFWFFNSANVEMLVKVLNGCSITNSYWVFAGGLTNVLARLTVTDMQTGAVRTYFNPQSTAFQPIQDTTAFATCP